MMTDVHVGPSLGCGGKKIMEAGSRGNVEERRAGAKLRAPWAPSGGGPSSDKPHCGESLLGECEWVPGMDRGIKSVCALLKGDTMTWKREINAQGRGKLYTLDEMSDNPAGKRLTEI